MEGINIDIMGIKKKILYKEILHLNEDNETQIVWLKNVTFSFPTHLLMDFYVASTSRLSQMMLQWAWVCKRLFQIWLLWRVIAILTQSKVTVWSSFSTAAIPAFWAQ